MRVSFSGIYDVRFPVGTSNDTFNEAKQRAENYVADNKLSPIYTLDCSDYLVHRPGLSEKGIRIIPSIDNPCNTIELLKAIDENLEQEYIDKTKVEFILPKEKYQQKYLDKPKILNEQA